MSLRFAALSIAFAAMACSPEHYVGSEPWTAAPDIRVAVISRPGEDIEVLALDGKAPLTGVLGDASSAEVWLFSYKADTLRAEFPGLAEDSTEQILAALKPIAGGAAQLPPPADEVMLAELGDGAKNPIAYERRTWTQWLERTGLSFTLEVPTAKLCGETDVTVIQGPPNVRLDAAVAVGPDHLLFTGRATGDPTVQLYSLENGVFTKLMARVELASSQSKPSWDATTNSAWDVDSRGNIFRFGLMGEPLLVPPPPDNPELTGDAAQVSVGIDGTLMATYYGRFVDGGMSVIQAALFRRQGSAWTVAQAYDGGYGAFKVISRNRVVAYYRCWLYYYRDELEASGWKQNLYNEGCSGHTMNTLNDWDIDTDGGVAVGIQRYVYVRKEETDEWIRQDKDLPLVDFVTATAIGQGRALITDIDGNIYVNRGRRWCATENPLAGQYKSGVSAPGGGIGYLIAPGQVVRVELK